MVLVGGLVPKFICLSPIHENVLRPVTLDVDLGVSIAVDGNMSPMDWPLKSLGFKENVEEGRFIATIGEKEIPIDFLTEHAGSSTSVSLAGIRANNLLGINRAIQTARIIDFEVTELSGEKLSLPLRVCEAGAYLMLKLRAFYHRLEPKDAYDLYYVIKHYDGKHRDGLNFIQQFKLEKESGNTAASDAINCLKTHFMNENGQGPEQAVSFVKNHVPDDQILEIRQTLVTAAQVMAE